MPPKLKELILAASVVMIVGILVNEDLSHAFLLLFATGLTIIPLFPLLRKAVTASPIIRIGALVFGLLGAAYYEERYIDAATRTITYRVGSVGNDGRLSTATGRGAQSHHGGVSHWITRNKKIERTPNQRCKEAFGVGFGLSVVVLTAIAGILPDVFNINGDRR
jgi:hypothetical protein